MSLTHRLFSRTFTSIAAFIFLVANIKGQCTFTVSASSPSICAGQTVTLSANGTISYTWTPGGTGSAVVQSPTVTQTYTVNGSDGSCTTTQTVNVVVVPVPTVAASSSTPVVCSGASAVLSYSGNASGANSGYYWLPGMSSAQSMTVSPSGSTIYTVVAYNAGGACTATASIQLSIYANPQLSFAVSESSLCSGSQLTITPSGASTYTLLPGNFTTATEFYLTASSTQYTVTGKDANTCVSGAVVPVTVVPSPSLVIGQTPTFVCAGQSTTLFTSGADVYNWQPGNLSSGTIVITPTTSVYFMVTGYNITGCTGVASTDVIVNSTPSLSFVNTNFTLCQGGAVSLSVTGANSYTWLPSNSNGSVLSVSPSGNAVYTVSGSATNGCRGTAYAGLVVSSNPVLTITGPSSLCAGSTLTLTGSGASSYTWAPGNLGTGTLVLTPSASQTYTLRGTNSAGCTGTTTSTVNVITVPVVQVSASSSSLCAGDTVILSANGAANYTWMPGAATGSSVTLTPSATTQYTAKGETSGCSSMDSVVVTVYALPFITIAADSVICPGQTLNLSAGGATTYTWMPWNLYGQQVSTTLSTSSSFTVTGTDQQGCISSKTSSVVLSAAPVLSVSAFPDSSCGPQTRTLLVSGATSYTWMPGGLGSAQVSVNPVSTQVYTVSGSNGQCSSSATTEVVTLTVPALTISSTSALLCAGESATISAQGAGSYIWDDGSGNSSIIVSPSLSATYTVTGTNNEGCSSTFTFVQEVSECTGVKEHGEKTDMLIYPNPANDFVVVDMPTRGSHAATLKLYDVQGQLLLSVQTTDFPARLDLTRFPASVYFLVVSDPEHQLTVSRIVIEK
jgi:hypothetical protein